MKNFENIQKKLGDLKIKIKNFPIKKTVIIVTLLLMVIISAVATAISASRNTETPYYDINADSPNSNIEVFNPNVDTTVSEPQKDGATEKPPVHTDERGLEFISNGNGTCYVNGFGSCTLREIDIPSQSPAGDTVVRISAKAFSGSSALLTIVIPSTVKTIDTGAFRGCENLVSITVDSDNSVYCSVGGILFSDDRSVLVCYPINRASNAYLLPTSVNSISAYAFEGVKNLKKLFYEENIASFQKINVLIGNDVLDTMTVTCNYVSAK